MGAPTGSADALPPPVEVRNLTKRYGPQFAVNGLSFSIRHGAVTGFLGPNGAGKSTALRMMLGLIRPTAGDARVHGVRYRDLARPLTAVGAVLDTEQFHPGRTGRHHLRYLAAAAGLEAGRVAAVLDLVELSGDADKHVGAYSLGMRQRLGLAAAMLGRPRLLILDEPANGLDPAGIRWLRAFVRDFAQAGGAVLMSSHQLGEVAQVVDDVVLIDKGRLVRLGALDDLLEGSHHVVHVRTDDPGALVRLLASSGIESEVRHGTVVARSAPEPVGRAMVEARLPVFEMRSESYQLEDLFFELTQEGVNGARHDPR